MWLKYEYYLFFIRKQKISISTSQIINTSVYSFTNSEFVYYFSIVSQFTL